MPQKGQKQVVDFQHNALTSLIHYVQLYMQYRELGMYVHCVGGQYLLMFLSFLWHSYS